MGWETKVKRVYGKFNANWKVDLSTGTLYLAVNDGDEKSLYELVHTEVDKVALSELVGFDQIAWDDLGYIESSIGYSYHREFQDADSKKTVGIKDGKDVVTGVEVIKGLGIAFQWDDTWYSTSVDRPTLFSIVEEEKHPWELCEEILRKTLETVKDYKVSSVFTEMCTLCIGDTIYRVSLKDVQVWRVKLIKFHFEAINSSAASISDEANSVVPGLDWAGWKKVQDMIYKIEKENRDKMFREALLKDKELYEKKEEQVAQGKSFDKELARQEGRIL